MRDALATHPPGRIPSAPLLSIEQAFSTISSGLAGGLPVTGHVQADFCILAPCRCRQGLSRADVVLCNQLYMGRAEEMSGRSTAHGPGIVQRGFIGWVREVEEHGSAPSPFLTTVYPTQFGLSTHLQIELNKE